MPTDALEQLLTELPSFARLRADERVRIAARFRRAHLAAGAAHALDPARPELLLVVDGDAELALADGAPLPLFAGDTLGELQVVTGRGPAGALTARTDMELALLDKAGLDALFADYPAIAPPWVAQLARELKERNDLLREISLAHAEGLPPAALARALARRRVRLQRLRRRPLRRAAARLLNAAVTVPRSRPSFWVLVGAALALATARTVVAMILRNGLQRRLFALIGGQVGHPIHVHHFNYGLLLVTLSGLLSLSPTLRKGVRPLAFVFGFGLGLIVDEFALLWNLNPDYYQGSSRVAAALVLLGLLQVVYLRRPYRSLLRHFVAWARR